MFSADDLKKIREDRNLTQQELADALGVSRVLLNKMEGGSKTLSRATQILLRDYLDGRHVNKVPMETKENAGHAGRNNETPPQGQGSEDERKYSNSALDKLIQANALLYEKVIAAKDETIAAQKTSMEAIARAEQAQSRALEITAANFVGRQEFDRFVAERDLVQNFALEQIAKVSAKGSSNPEKEALVLQKELHKRIGDFVENRKNRNFSGANK